MRVLDEVLGARLGRGAALEQRARFRAVAGFVAQDRFGEEELVHLVAGMHRVGAPQQRERLLPRDEARHERDLRALVVEPPEDAVAEAEEAIRDILGTLRLRTGHDFSQYKRATLLRRVERRLQVNQLRSLRAYRDFMAEHPAEAPAAKDDGEAKTVEVKPVEKPAEKPKPRMIVDEPSIQIAEDLLEDVQRAIGNDRTQLRRNPLLDAPARTPPPPVRTAPTVPEPGVIASVTVSPGANVAMLSSASNPVTRTVGVMLNPARVCVGCTVNASRTGAPPVMLKALLTSGVSAPEVASKRYPVPEWSRSRPCAHRCPVTARASRFPCRRHAKRCAYQASPPSTASAEA